MKTIKDIFSKIIKFILKITGDDLSIYAAQASFFIIISVIPFSMLVLSIIKLFINIDINSILHHNKFICPCGNQHVSYGNNNRFIYQKRLGASHFRNRRINTLACVKGRYGTVYGT